jgi:hypothetical protein
MTPGDQPGSSTRASAAFTSLNKEVRDGLVGGLPPAAECWGDDMQRKSDAAGQQSNLKTGLARLALSVLLAGAILGAVGAAPAAASSHRDSPGCRALEAGDLDFLNIPAGGGPFVANRIYNVKFGEEVTVFFSNLDRLKISVDGKLVVDLTNPVDGLRTFTLEADGSVTVEKEVTPDAVTDGEVTFSCAGAPIEPTDPDGPDDPFDEASYQDRRRLVANSLFSELFFPHGGLPDSPGGSALDAELTQCRRDLRLAEREVDLARKNFEEVGQPRGPDLDVANLAIDRAIAKRNGVLKKCEDLRARIDAQGANFAADQHAGGLNVPWPVEATTFGPDYRPMQNISGSGDHSFTLGGLPVKAWVLVKGTILDGSLGRRGGSGQAVFGVVAPVTPSLDIGVFGHILAGEVDSAPLATELDAVMGGVGAYAKLKLPHGFRLDASISHGWGSNDIVIAGGAGTFPSSHFMFDASLARPFEFGNFVVTPMALITYNRMSLGAYTDSNGVAVPRATDSTFAISGAVALAYPIQVNGRIVSALVPRVSLRGNFYANRADTLTLGPTLTLEGDSLTVDLSGGVGLSLARGGTLDLSLAASGLGGSVQGYSLRGVLTLPLN